MCGICGAYNLDGQPIEQALIRKMCDVIAHRGPDDEGIFIDGNIGLGVRRLSIIDLVSGHQPMANEDGSLRVVFNGEIYNYRELRDELLVRGHRLLSRSDTEVILHCYEEWGDQWVNRIQGMFAIALWDARSRKVLLARDRLGIKPLFYSLAGNKLVFGSEVKALLQHPLIKREVDISSLHCFLSLNYVPSPLSMFKGIKQLEPGHVLECGDSGVVTRRFWDLPCSRSDGETGEMPEGYYLENLGRIIRAAVKRHLISDVPIGLFLSGGIDSTSLLSVLADVLQGAPIQTFSIGFEEKSFDELSYARAAARHFGTEHYEEVCTSQQCLDLLPRIIWHTDNVLADPSTIPTFMVSRLARQHVKVVLSGDGGDEIFAGYPTYIADVLAGQYRRLVPAFVRRSLIYPLIQALPPSHSKMSLDFKLKRFSTGAEMSPEQAHCYWRTVFADEEKRDLYADGMTAMVEESLPFAGYEGYFLARNGADIIEKSTYADIKVFLPDLILTKLDTMTMANSLEGRVPFLDTELVEFAATIPSSLKLKRQLTGFTSKYILKQLTGCHLPRKIRTRGKAGFSPPLAEWFVGDLKPMVTDVLSPSAVKKTGFFNPKAVERVLSEHFAHKAENSYKIWALLNFQLWHETFM